MDQTANILLASPRLVKGDAMLIFGLSQRCPCVGNPAIPSQWNSFLPHLGQIDGQIGNVAYGVIYNSNDSGDYDYICGVAVHQFPPPSAGVHAVAHSSPKLRGIRASRTRLGHCEYVEGNLGAWAGRQRI